MVKHRRQLVAHAGLQKIVFLDNGSRSKSSEDSLMTSRSNLFEITLIDERLETILNSLKEKLEVNELAGYLRELVKSVERSHRNIVAMISFGLPSLLLKMLDRDGHEDFTVEMHRDILTLLDWAVSCDELERLGGSALNKFSSGNPPKPSFRSSRWSVMNPRKFKSVVVDTILRHIVDVQDVDMETKLLGMDILGKLAPFHQDKNVIVLCINICLQAIKSVTDKKLLPRSLAVLLAFSKDQYCGQYLMEPDTLDFICSKVQVDKKCQSLVLEILCNLHRNYFDTKALVDANVVQICKEAYRENLEYGNGYQALILLFSLSRDARASVQLVFDLKIHLFLKSILENPGTSNDNELIAIKTLLTLLEHQNRLIQQECSILLVPLANHAEATSDLKIRSDTFYSMYYILKETRAGQLKPNQVTKIGVVCAKTLQKHRRSNHGFMDMTALDIELSGPSLCLQSLFILYPQICFPKFLETVLTFFTEMLTITDPRASTKTSKILLRFLNDLLKLQHSESSEEMPLFQAQQREIFKLVEALAKSKKVTLEAKQIIDQILDQSKKHRTSSSFSAVSLWSRYPILTKIKLLFSNFTNK